MKNWNYFALACWLLPALGLAQPGDAATALPPAQVPRTAQVDVRHVSLNLQVDWAKKQVFGVAQIRLAPLRDTGQIALDAGFLDIQSVRRQGGPGPQDLRFQYDGSDKDGALRIDLGQVLPAGHEVTLDIAYRSNWLNLSDPNTLGGSTGKGLRFLGPTATDPTRRKQLWSMGEPHGNRYWFPGHDHPSDFHSSELRATVDKGLTVVSNGHLVGTQQLPDGQQTFHWHCAVPHANHLSSIVVGEYTETPLRVGALELRSFGYPDEVAATQASIVRLPDMLRYFQEKMQTPYPFAAYAQVFVQDFPNTQAYAGTATVTENMVDDAPTHAEFLYLWDLTEAEGLANQWFGGLTSCADWRDVWLNKAFGRYLSGQFTGHQNGRDEYLLYQLTFDQGTYLADWNAGNRRPIVTANFADAEAFAAENHPYFRAAAVLHTLHKQIGDAAFWHALTIFLQENARKPATTADFQRVVEKACGTPMQWFFDQWFYQVGHPVFEVSKQYDAAAKTLTLTVRQLQQPDPQSAWPQAAFFQGNVELALDGRIETLWIKPQRENVFVFAAPERPRFVHFDVEDAWLKELRLEQPLAEWLDQFQHSPHVLAQNRAMNRLVGMARDSATTADQKALIHAAFRQVIAGKSYWRLRFSATGQLQGLVAPFWQTEPVALDEATSAMLLRVIRTEKMWNRRAAVNFLGMSRDTRHAPLYRQLLLDEADRVVNAAAIALGKCKNPDAFEALDKLRQRPSWKSQSLISALNGLRELGDPRGEKIALDALADLRSPHWTLATPIWDYRLAAAETLAALGTTEQAYPLLLAHFERAAAERDQHGMFYTALLVATLGDARGHAIFEQMKKTCADDPRALAALAPLEAQFLSTQSK